MDIALWVLAGAAVGALGVWAVLAARLSAATTRLAEAESRRTEAEAEKAAALGRRDEAEKARIDAERDAAVARRDLANWEATKKEFMDAAKAATVQTALDTSSKLLADHKRETDAAKAETEERVKKATAALAERFDKAAGVIAALDGQVKRHDAELGTFHKALTTPGGIGQFAEVTLENALKAFGLRPEIDFLTQHHLPAEAGRGALRPDAVIFLPRDGVLVVDCKASKHLTDAAAAASGDGEALAEKRFAEAMGGHLKSLAAKDYAAAVIQALDRKGRKTDADRVFTCMFLPTDGAVERLEKADPRFRERADAQRIVVAGPAGLRVLILLCKGEIDQARRAENYSKIVEATASLMEAAALAFEKADKVEKGLKGAAEGFADFARSANRFLLPRMARLAQLGVQPAKNRKLPEPLKPIEVLERADVIDVESEPVPPALEDKRGLN